MGTFNGTLFGGGSGSIGPAGTTPASKLFYAAMRKARITLTPGRGPSPDQLQDALDECNRMIGTWNCERPKIFTIRIDQFPLTGAKSYTIGIDPSGSTTADFNAPRPQEIQQANLIYPSTPTVVRVPITLLTDEEWSQIAVQDIPNSPTQKLYNDGGYPFSTLFLWPQAPSGYSLELYSWQSVPKFSSTNDVVTLPDGYEDAIVLNLACRLAPMWGFDLSPLVLQQAQKALGAIASKNSPNPPKVSVTTPRGGFNYLRGY